MRIFWRRQDRGGLALNFIAEIGGLGNSRIAHCERGCVSLVSASSSSSWKAFIYLLALAFGHGVLEEFWF
jgi:hypothetical protein